MTFWHVRIIAAGAGGYLTAMFSTYLQPLLLSGLQQTFGLSPAEVGAVVALDAGFCALTAILLGLVARRMTLSYKTLGIIGVLIAAVSNFLCAATDSMSLILALRVTAGIGEGMALAAGMATLGAVPKPDRKIAAVLALGAVLGSTAIMLAPAFGVIGNAYQMFIYQGAVTLIVGSLMVLLPPIEIDAAAQATTFKVRGPKALSVLAGSVLIGISASMVWAFATMVGTDAGLSVAGTAAVISIAAYFGVLGSTSAAILGTRFGRGWPITIAVVVECAALALLVIWATPETFAIGLCAILVVGMFVRPFLMAIASLIDPTGGLTGSMSGGVRLGGFIGPMLGGVVIELAGTPHSVVVIQIVLMPVIALIFLSLQRNHLRQSEPQASVAAA